MTHSPTPAELLAIRTGNAALLNSRDASVDIVATIVFALGSAGLLMDPEKAKRFAELEAAAAEIRQLHTDSPMGPCPLCINEDALVRGDDYTVPWPCPTAQHAGAVESRPVDEDPIAYALTEQAEDVSPQRQQVRELIGRQRAAAEDPHDSPLHHTYRVCRDLPLPEVTS